MKPSIEEIEFHGIAALRLNGPRGASAVVSKLGAQVLSWVTPDVRERLFLSDKAVFDGSVAIRGGIPVCWPQFAGLGELPKAHHGVGLRFSKRAQLGVDVLDQGCVIEGTHGGESSKDLNKVGVSPRKD
mgnify:CR=1 FL=1